MPFEPDGAIWGTLLGSSRVHGNTELAEIAAYKIFAMEPDNSGMYVLLSNLYASLGRWVGKLRVRMRDKGVKKVTGYSWIQIQNKTHTFSVGDHAEKEEIYALMEDLDLRMKRAGYVSKTSEVLHVVEEEEKERMVRYHSERLAVAYGIMRVSPGKPIRVIKNMRVCEDCHSAIKCMAKITGKVSILRDNNRFHHFKD
ncbi:Pentatricopeptide repeat-containing protein [Raphanus sativus]|nr:Pentatricopeptide repeat-containing protein [Raphanus sativus]